VGSRDEPVDRFVSRRGDPAAAARTQRDRAVYAVAGVALLVYALHGFQGRLVRDVAIYSYGAQQVVDGVPPYVGILNRAGPLAHLLPAAGVVGARLAGISDLLGMRLLFLLFAVASVCAVYGLTRTLFGSPLAGVAAAATFLSFHGFIRYAAYGPREKTPMVLFVVSALIAMTNRRWAVGGACFSLATLVWQPAAVVGALVVATALVGLPAPERRPALVRIVVGGLVPALACLVYFARAGALSELFDAFLFINLQYTPTDPLTDGFERKWGRLVRGYGASRWGLFVGVPAFALAAAAALRTRSWRSQPGLGIVMTGVAAVAAVLWTVRDFQSWPDAFLVLPFAAVGVGGLARLAMVSLPRGRGQALVAIWSAAAVVMAATYSITNRDDGLVEQERSVAAITAQLPPGATIVSIVAPQVHVLAGTTNPTRHQTFSRGLASYVEDTWPGGLRGYAADMHELRPAAFATRGPRAPDWADVHGHPDYRRVRGGPGWVWYIHRSVKIEQAAGG
jgi:hypothetical protein